jgi:hypothetical protein
LMKVRSTGRHISENEGVPIPKGSSNYLSKGESPPLLILLRETRSMLSPEYKASVAEVRLEKDSKNNFVVGSSGWVKDLGIDNQAPPSFVK